MHPCPPSRELLGTVCSCPDRDLQPNLYVRSSQPSLVTCHFSALWAPVCTVRCCEYYQRFEIPTTVALLAMAHGGLPQSFHLPLSDNCQIVGCYCFGPSSAPAMRISKQTGVAFVSICSPAVQTVELLSLVDGEVQCTF